MENKVILLVEDNPDDEVLTTHALTMSKIPHQVVVARSGSQAMDYLFGRRADADRGTLVLPQLVLLNLNLHKKDGQEVLRAIRGDRRTSRLPVVIFTAADRESDRLESYDLGANSYICKPVDFADFAEALKQIANYWLVLNQSPPSPREPSPS